jgi:hypothetical protein
MQVDLRRATLDVRPFRERFSVNWAICGALAAVGSCEEKLKRKRASGKSVELRTPERGQETKNWLGS